jgi:Rad3-related DNA helicase
VVSLQAIVKLKLPIRVLAQLTCRSGDIHFRYDEATLSQEGIALQKRLQRDRGVTYQREVAVNGHWRNEAVLLTLAGRADGFDPDAAVVEEFKTTRADPQRLHDHAGSVHRGQLRLYAALLARDAPQHARWRLRLLYCHPDTSIVMPFEETLTVAQLDAFLNACCERLAGRLSALAAHRAFRDAQLRALDFPHPQFRGSQRRLAADVYRTVRDGGALIVEAPTGSGKTMGTLFPALRAMGDGHTDRVVFLSSRTTGQSAAESAAEMLNTSQMVRLVTITAKAKICFMPEPICDPELCEFARGYYDRVEGAVDELVERRTMNRVVIEDVARKHRVCPFELTLDAAVWSDVVLCDYNYVFDPVVRLKRLAGIAHDRVALLVDEAHQLGDRVREGLSTVFLRSTLRAARARMEGSRVARAAAALDRRLLALRTDLVRTRGVDRHDFECAIEMPQNILRAAQALFEAFVETAAQRGHDAEVTELTFALVRLLRAAAWFDPARFTVIARGRRRDIEFDIRCVDPSSAIAETLSEFGAHIRFSATLSPFHVYARVHGQSDARALRLPSPFPRERLGVFVVPDVSTLYRARARSLHALADTLCTLVSAHPGNYLVALPSFEYLDLVAEAFAARAPELTTLRQRRVMSDPERAAYLERFHAAGEPVVGFVVLGGVFTESVDLPGDALIGIAIVGIGLPPPSLERTEMASRFGASYGAAVAYEQPAMTRVIQAAGRLIRRESDRGVLCLIDGRYLAQPYRDYLPRHWPIQRTPARTLATSLDAFWNKG